jgi:hypothetical protein
MNGLNKSRTKLAFILSSSQNLDKLGSSYVHQQLMLSKASNKVIARYMTSSTMAITI